MVQDMSYNDPILKETITALKNETSNKAKGLRLRYLREYTGLARAEIAKIAGVTYGTYKDWEIGYFNVPRRRIEKMIDELCCRDFVCSAEWVEHGAGLFPAWSENKKIKAELEVFFNVNPNATSFEVSNQSMFPIYQCGDIVAGIKYEGNDVQSAMNKDCIIELEDETILFRNLKKSNKQKLFNLISTNLNSENPIISEVKIKSAAPVIWIRRRLETRN